MTRTEHVAWAKARALEYVEMGDPAQAYASLASDLGKHAETSGHAAIELGIGLLMIGDLRTAAKMREFVEGVQ